MASVSFRKLEKSYGDVKIVKGIDLDIQDREFVVLVGPSGCGKSTTLRMLAGLERITGGEVMIGERVVNDLPPRERDIAMVFQDYALYPHKTVYDNMAFGLKVRKHPAAEIRPRVEEAAGILGIGHLLERMPKQLSGGQRQRVAMGRAIVRRPQVFLFDEPLSNLDAQLRGQVRTEIKKLHQAIGTTSIYVTHDQVEAMTLADRIVILRGGEIEQIGTPDEVYGSPASVFVGGFIGSPPMNFAKAEIAAEGAALVFADGQRLALRDGRTQSRTGQKVTVGIRPEHFVTGDSSAPKLRCRVEVIEPLGADTLVMMTVGKDELVARVPPGVRPEPGSMIEIGVDTARIHLFDAASERTLH